MKKKSAIPRPSPPRPGTEAEADVARDLALCLAQRRAQGKSGTYTKEEQLLNQPKTAPQGIIEDGFTTPPNSTTPERPEMKDGQPLPAPVCDVEATEVRMTALFVFLHFPLFTFQR